jgi:ryanodine receptor 2
MWLLKIWNLFLVNNFLVWLLKTKLKKKKKKKKKKSKTYFYLPNSRMQQREDSEANNMNPNEIRFAYNLLEKLLHYVDRAATNMQSIKESSKFSRKDSFKSSGADVKFFTKVILTDFLTSPRS